MTEYITKGQAVDATYRAIHYGFSDVHKAMMEGKDLKVDADNFYYTLLENVRAEIAVAPVADVAPVVRCKDCKNLYPDDTGKLHWCDCHRMFVGLDDFCNYGKRMDGGNSDDQTNKSR